MIEVFQCIYWSCAIRSANQSPKICEKFYFWLSFDSCWRNFLIEFLLYCISHVNSFFRVYTVSLSTNLLMKPVEKETRNSLGVCSLDSCMSSNQLLIAYMVFSSANLWAFARSRCIILQVFLVDNWLINDLWSVWTHTLCADSALRKRTPEIPPSNFEFFEFFALLLNQSKHQTTHGLNT